MYTITDTGRDTAREWLREMLVETRGDYPEFIAAVSILFVMSPVEAQDLLEERAERVADDLVEAEVSSPPIRGFPGCSLRRGVSARHATSRVVVATRRVR